MTYIFKERIKYSQYIKFIKNYPHLSFMQEDNWAKTKNNTNHLIVAVLKNDEVCALSQILINKRKGGYQFFIPNGYLMDFTDKKVLKVMTQGIKSLAHKYNAYIIDVYPNIDSNISNIETIHNNFISLDYNYKKEYFDNTDNILIPLKHNNKFISKNELKNKYENKDYYLKKGIYFEISDNIEDIKRIKYLITDEHINTDLIGNLFMNFPNRIKIVFARLDLVFYKNYLKENDNNYEELLKINELLTISDDIDIGCALIVEPISKNNSTCEFIYNTEKESFTNLGVMNGMIYEAMKICHKNKYDYIKVSNINLDKDFYINRYNATSINYIGHYSIILSKFKFFINKKYH